MGLENFHLTVMPDPMVAEANIYDLGEGKILSDSVLAKYFQRLNRFSPKESLLRSHVLWLTQVFPQLLSSLEIPQPWIWSDLVMDADNVGTVGAAAQVCANWVQSSENVAYWTGGLEFTQNHYSVAKWLLENGYVILLGVEPYTYPEEGDKNRGAITDDIVPISLWSRVLVDRGFVFSIPRPRPADVKELDEFYRMLYEKITNGEACIVVSELDPHKEEKVKRGKTVVVPEFHFPSTTDLHASYY